MITAKGGFDAKSGKLVALDGGLLPKTLLKHYINGVSGTVIPTYFFRTTFQINSLEDVDILKGSIYYNDAAIVYINEKIIQSWYAPNADGTFPTNMSYGGSNQTSPLKGDFSILNAANPGLLKQGENTIAVDLHNGSTGSSDIYFDFSSLSAVKVVNSTVNIIPHLI